jgi:uncharacterized protein YbbK (DUF523 family)
MIIVSACLLGINCKYNGDNNFNQAVEKFLTGKQYCPVCPEQSGGLSTPRFPCEISGGNGDDVLDGKARVFNSENQDLTEYFLEGAHSVLRQAQENNASLAILKARSPSCGSGRIYDGAFSGRQVPGDGVTAALLKRHGVKVISELDLTSE